VKKVAVVTGTRSEYGILRPVIRALRADKDLDVHVIVTGSILEKAYGDADRLLRGDGFKVSAKICVEAFGQRGYGKFFGIDGKDVRGGSCAVGCCA